MCGCKEGKKLHLGESVYHVRRKSNVKQARNVGRSFCCGFWLGEQCVALQCVCFFDHGRSGGREMSVLWELWKAQVSWHVSRQISTRKHTLFGLFVRHVLQEAASQRIVLQRMQKVATGQGKRFDT